MNTSSLDREILAACRFASRDIRYFTHRMTYPRHEKTVLAAMKALQRAGYLTEEVPGHWTTTLSGCSLIDSASNITPGHLVTNCSMTERYDGAELRPFAGRPGAMDAFSLPSRGFRT